MTTEPYVIHHGDCLDILPTLPDASVDAVVTDPPYGLEFMGKEWDSFKTGRGEKYAAGGSLNLEDIASQSGKGGAGPVYVNRPAKRCAKCGKQAWSGSPCKCDEPEWVMDNSPLLSFQSWCQLWAAECLRVLRPGGHLLAFGGTRTSHRLACAIEDAGFEIRDSIAWLYGCLSDDTEVLTADGWVRYDRAKEGQPALAFDTTTGDVEWQPIQQVQRYWYDGEMVRLHSDDTDQLLTPNHRVVLEDGTPAEVPYVPSHEDLRRLLDGLPSPQPLPVGTQADLFAGVRGEADLGHEDGSDQAARGAQGTDSVLRHLRNREVATGLLAGTADRDVLLAGVQRGPTRPGVGDSRPQGESGADARELPGGGSEDDRREQPRLEGRRYRVQEAWELCRGQVRASATVGAADGSQGRLHHGAPSPSCGSLRVSDDAAGSRQPRGPRPDEQPPREPDAVAVEPRSQALRVGSDGDRRVLPSTRVEATRVGYAGVVWCVTVASGAFIARRNGLIFATGNSGFPKSLDVSKAIDKAAGAEREVVGSKLGLPGYSATQGNGDHRTYGTGLGNTSDGVLEATITAPATDDARTWQGWGTALKPSHEPVVCARKPFNVVSFDWRLVTRVHHALAGLLWLSLSPVKRAGSLSASSRAEPSGPPLCVSALVSVALDTSPDEPAKTDTFNSPATASTSLNIASSWSVILAALSDSTTTSTTSTALSMTTALRILSSLLAPVTSPSTMPVCGCPLGGLLPPVTNADGSSSDEWRSWLHTLTASVTESVGDGTRLAVESALASLAESLSNGPEAGSSAPAPATTSTVTGTGSGTGEATGGSRPAHEPIVVARKPLVGTVASNVLRHGTGALNVDGCRIGDALKIQTAAGSTPGAWIGPVVAGEYQAGTGREYRTGGRWPANVVLDEDQAAALDQMSGVQRDGVAVNRNRGELRPQTVAGVPRTVLHDDQGYGGQGGASRFFFVSKGKVDRIETCERVNTAEPTSSQSSTQGDSAPSDAATSERLDTLSPTLSVSMSDTARESKQSVETSTPTTPSTDAKSSPASRQLKPSLTSNPANDVEPNEPTDTTTTTTSRSRSAGSAADATSSTTSRSKAPGVQDSLDALPLRAFYTAKATSAERPRIARVGAGEGRVTGLGGKIRECNVCGSKAINSGATELTCGHNDHAWVDNPRPEFIAHPTVKPLRLMRWLVRLVCPPGGVVLDPFLGSGTTVEACRLEGFRCIGIEREADYIPLIHDRLRQGVLDFGDTA